MMLKRYITGSNLFFKGMPDFNPHDIDYCELHDTLPVMYQKDETAEWDVYQWRKTTPEAYIRFANTHCSPWQICQFLTPGFCRDVGFTIEHLKQLQPLRSRILSKHAYLGMIFDAFIENNGFFLTKEQQETIYKEYQEKRKYDKFFNTND